MKLTRRSSLSLMAGAALAMPYISRARAEEAVLNVFNWVDYIGETTVEDFQSATGIQVTYDVYDSTEAMEAKMLAGPVLILCFNRAQPWNASSRRKFIKPWIAPN